MGGFLSKRAPAKGAGVEGELAHVYGTAGGEDLIGSFWDASDSARPSVILVTVKHVELYHPDSGKCSHHSSGALGEAASLPRLAWPNGRALQRSELELKAPRSSGSSPRASPPPRCAQCSQFSQRRRQAHARGAAGRGVQRLARANLLLRRCSGCWPQTRHDRGLRRRDAQVRPRVVSGISGPLSLVAFSRLPLSRGLCACVCLPRDDLSCPKPSCPFLSLLGCPPHAAGG